MSNKSPTSEWWEAQSLLPNNSSKFEKALEQVSTRAFKFQNNDTLNKDEFGHQLHNQMFEQLWNPQTCPDHLLPYLAWALSVDEWPTLEREKWQNPNISNHLNDGTLNDEVLKNKVLTKQRQVVKESFKVHRHKGTIGSVKRALDSFDIKVELVELADLPQDELPEAYKNMAKDELPFCVEIRALAHASENLDEQGNSKLTRQTQQYLLQLLQDLKPVRTHLALAIDVRHQANLKIAALSTAVSQLNHSWQAKVEHDFNAGIQTTMAIESPLITNEINLEI